MGRQLPRNGIEIFEKGLLTLDTIKHSLSLLILTLIGLAGSLSVSFAQDARPVSPTGARTYTADEIPDHSTGYFIPLTNEDGVILPTIVLRGVIIYPPMYFANAKQRVNYTRLTRDVKKALPYAKIVARTMMETYEYIQTLPTEKERERHLKRMEKEVYKQYYPEMRKLTLNQGKILLKLIMRETGGSTSYNLIESFLGSFAAGFWNTVAGLFGATLKTTWDPNGQDATLERICVEIEQGMV